HRAGDLDQLAVLLDASWPPAGELDRVRPSLGRAAPITPYDAVATGQGRGGFHHPGHDADRVPEQARVARLVDEGVGDRAVQPDHIACFDLFLTGAPQHSPID